MLVCVCSLTMARPGTPLESILAWHEQFRLDRPLRPIPKDGELRTWKGNPDERDFDRLRAFKVADGWAFVHEGREFVEWDTKEVKDRVSL